jgi:hypothetical protein
MAEAQGDVLWRRASGAAGEPLGQVADTLKRVTEQHKPKKK